MKIREVLRNPRKIIYSLGMKGKLGFIEDDKYLKLMYWANTGEKLNLDNPTNFTEKLQWLKLYDKDIEYKKMVDKYEAKEWIATKIGKEFVIPTLGVWDSFDEIDFDELPNQFVLKCTHDSGGLVICKDKKIFDFDDARKKIIKSLKRNYFVVGREYPYKNIKPRIIAEKYMEDIELTDINECKLFNLERIARALFIEPCQVGYTRSVVKFKDLKNDYYSALKIYFEEMLKIVNDINKNREKIYTRFYAINEKSLFGELIFLDITEFDFEKYNSIYKNMIKLSEDIGGYVIINNGWVLWIHKAITNECLTDYKFFCFNGIPKLIYVGRDKASDPRTDFFDMNFTHLPIQMRDCNADIMPQKPILFDEMKKIAAKLSDGCRHLRVDFYLINGNIYVGELTFFHCSGFTIVKPKEWNEILGSWIII